MADNYFGNVARQYGNEELEAAKYIAQNLGNVSYGSLPEWLGAARPAISYPADVVNAGLLGLLGGSQKAIAFGAEMFAGDTNREKQLTRDILGGLEVAGVSPQGRMAAALSAPAMAQVQKMAQSTKNPTIGQAAAETYMIGQKLSPPEGYSGAGGKPSAVSIPDSGRFAAKPINAIEKAAIDYMEKRGMDTTAFSEYPPFSEERARLIAAAYDMMQHTPDDKSVQRAYDAMIQETIDQYNSLKDAGIEFKFLREGMDDPYAKSPAMGYQDLVENGRLWVFPTDFGFGTSEAFDPSTNPLLKRVGKIGDKENAVANDAFRAVHDAFGHFGSGNPFFRHKGEERAFLEHSRMYSPEARGAMTSETRGQNSWLNFGPYGDTNRQANTLDTVFADQKTGLMSPWTYEPQGMPSEEEARNLIEYLGRWKRQ